MRLSLSFAPRPVVDLRRTTCHRPTILYIFQYAPRLRTCFPDETLHACDMGQKEMYAAYVARKEAFEKVILQLPRREVAAIRANMGHIPTRT